MAELGHKGAPAIEGKIFKNRGFDTSDQGYETSLGFFGGGIKEDAEGKTVFDMRSGLDKKRDTFDRFGDPRVRSIDEHTANAGLFLKHTGKVWKRRVDGVLEALKIKSKSQEQQRMDETWEQNKHKWEDREKVQNVAPRSLLKLAAEGYGKGYAARYRGTPGEIAANAERLGLEDFYGAHPWGIEIKKPEIYTEGTSLYDIIVANKEGKTPLQDIDKNHAIAESAKYIRGIHDAHGGIGELLVMDIQFQNRDGATVSNPVLGLPDVVWNNDATLSETSKKATDVLDFLVNLSFWEHKAGSSPETIQAELDNFLGNYGDEKVVRAVRAFINPDRKSKKPTLPGENKLGLLHNVARLGADAKLSSTVRNEVFDATVRYLHPTQQAT